MRPWLGAAVATGIFVVITTVAPVRAEIACASGEAVGRPLVDVPAAAGEFRRSADGLVCWAADEKGETAEKTLRPAPYRLCLRLGGLGLGDTSDDVKRVLKEAPVTHRSVGGFTVEGYPVPGPDGRTVAYILVGTIGDRVVGLFLSEHSRQVPMGSSTVRLGHTPQQVLDLLGPPEVRCADEELEFQEWIWASVPIRLRITFGQVDAIGLGFGYLVGLE